MNHALLLAKPFLVSALGFLGGLMFALCGVPAARASWKLGKAVAPASTAWLIFWGGVLMYAYLLLTYGFNPLLTFNYSVEVGSWAVVLRYHYFPRREKPLTEVLQPLLDALKMPEGCRELTQQERDDLYGSREEKP